jgi:hypothetical protein
MGLKWLNENEGRLVDFTRYGDETLVATPTKPLKEFNRLFKEAYPDKNYSVDWAILYMTEVLKKTIADKKDQELKDALDRLGYEPKKVKK